MISWRKWPLADTQVSLVSETEAADSNAKHKLKEQITLVQYVWVTESLKKTEVGTCGIELLQAGTGWKEKMQDTEGTSANTNSFPSHYPSNILSTTQLIFPCWWKCISGVKEETTAYLLQTWTSVSSAKSKSVRSRWCIGDHLNSGIRNIVVRGPGLNCRRCSSVIGIPRNPKSTRKSRSCCVTDRPCTAYINKKFKNHVNVS